MSVSLPYLKSNPPARAAHVFISFPETKKPDTFLHRAMFGFSDLQEFIQVELAECGGRADDCPQVQEFVVDNSVLHRPGSLNNMPDDDVDFGVHV